MNRETQQAAAMLQTLVNTKDYFTKNNLHEVSQKTQPLFKDIYKGISDLTRVFYGCRQLEKNYVLDTLTTAMDQYSSLATFFIEFDKWRKTFSSDLDNLNKHVHVTDYMFYKFFLHIKNASEAELLANLISKLDKIKDKSPSDYKKILAFHNNFAFYWGKLDPSENNYEVFENRIHELKEHSDKFIWLYEHLADYRSKKVLWGIVHFWLEMDYDVKKSIIEGNYDSYFDLDILSDITDEEVFVDCGAYKGDTAQNYIKNFSSYKKMYLYELSPSLLKKAEEALKDYPDIVYKNCGVGNGTLANKKVFINDNSAIATLSLLDPANAEIISGEDENQSTPDAKIPVPVITLDKDIDEKISFIKMDIEGVEPEALDGCKNHIKIDKPKLAISTYHKNNHIWGIPEYINKINPDYKFYLRYYGSVLGFTTSEYIFFAV